MAMKREYTYMLRRQLMQVSPFVISDFCK